MGHDHLDHFEGADDSLDGVVDRRRVLRRLAGLTALTFAAPQIVATRHAAAQTLSGCFVTYDFDDGTLQGWTTNGTGQARWRLDNLHPNSGTGSVWFGRAGTSNSLHPIVGERSYAVNSASRAQLVSPPMSLSSTDIVAFSVRLAIENHPSYDAFTLNIVQGNTRRTLWTKASGLFTVIDHPEAPWQNTYQLFTTFGGYAQQNVTIGSPQGIDLAQPVRLEFDMQVVDTLYNRTEGIYLDDIVVPCSAVTPAGAPSARSSIAGEQPWTPPPEITAEPREIPEPPPGVRPSRSEAVPGAAAPVRDDRATGTRPSRRQSRDQSRGAVDPSQPGSTR